MDIQKKYRWALIGLTIMMLLNAVTLFTIWTNNPHKGSRVSDRQNYDRNEMHQSIKEQLDLSETQSQQIMEIRRSHYREMRLLRAKLDDYRKLYLDMAIADNEENNTQKDSLMNLLSEQYMQLEHSMFTHFSEMKSVLNQQQQEAFKELMLNSFLHKGTPHTERPDR